MSRPFVLLPASLLLIILVLPLSAAALDILVLPTAIDREMDAWHHVPVNSEPTLYPTKRIYRAQPFRLLVIAKDYTINDQSNADISYKVQFFAPNGRELLGQKRPMELYKGRVGNDALLLASQQFLTLDFSASDPLGRYQIKVTAHDTLSNLQALATVELTLAAMTDRPDFTSTEDLSNWLTNYYREPDPARAVTALRQYVDPESLAAEKQVSLLTFLSTVVRDNPFLWPHLKAIYLEAGPEDRKRILLLAALTDQQDDAFFSSLGPEFSAYYAEANRVRLPVPSDRPSTGIEIDTLWAEFMATGTIAPVRKLVGTLHLGSYRGTQDKIAAGRLIATPENKVKASLESVYQSALGSLLQNGQNHSLVRQYLGYIYDLEDLDPAVKSQLGELLAILKQRTNEDAARQHLEKQDKKQE